MQYCISTFTVMLKETMEVLFVVSNYMLYVLMT